MFHANSEVDQAAKSWIEFNFESPFNFVFIPFMSFAWLETFLAMLTQHRRGEEFTYELIGDENLVNIQKG